MSSARIDHCHTDQRWLARTPRSIQTKGTSSATARPEAEPSQRQPKTTAAREPAHSNPLVSSLSLSTASSSPSPPPFILQPRRDYTDHHRLESIAPLLEPDSPAPAPAWLPGPFVDPSPAKARLQAPPAKAKAPHRRNCSCLSSSSRQRGAGRSDRTWDRFLPFSR
jgi:hypothetical protein